ncbi:MAG TPA: adenylate/guanylate cyclase domain-containing protein [Solirubrobacterales bacterium]
MTATPGKDDAERKQVTVLFADVKGSMDLAEQHDPEEWRKIMQRFFSILAEGVERFEGTVDKFTGDGIMAVFGAPIAHEDHARRACYAALQMLDDVSGYAAELRRAEGLNFSVRIGVNSGEVVAGKIGAGGVEGDYTAIGHTVGLAQRMEALAEPGKAYLTESAAALAEGFVELDDLGEFEIKGASRPVRVFELAGVGSARSRLDLSRARGFSRFVGRAEEMSAFEEALAQADGGRGSAVAVVAGPGTGKSRLCHEFAERCRQEEIEVFEAQAQAHGKEIPFMPVLQMLRAYFGIDDGDPERLAREKIAGRALLLDTSLADSLPLIFDFLGVPDPDRPAPQLSAEARRRALGEFVSHLVNSPERKKAVVLVVEDLHWIDDGSASMLGELFITLCDSPTMLVVNYRPEYEPAWQEDEVKVLELGPLSEANTRELLRDLAGEDPSLDGLPELVHQRAQGNPFFIEEIVRELAEAGYLEGERSAYRLARPVEDAGVPPTVQAILAARIDRLSPDAKRLLQVASVVGKELGAEALSVTSGFEQGELDPVLAELTGGGFLYEAELYPERILAFQHPLTREVAYSTQLAERREQTHAAAARAIVELEPERQDELAALIAQHMESGGETLEAARWSARAAYWTGSSQPVEALRLWQATARLADELPENEETAALRVMSRLQQLDYAWRLGMDDEQERQLADEAREIAERTRNLPALAMLKMATAARPGLAIHVDEWIAAADEASRIADESGDLHLRVSMRAAGAYARLCSGAFDGYEAMLDEVLELSGGDPAIGAGVVIGNPVAWAHMGKGLVRKERGEFESAATEIDRALKTAREAHDPESESWILGMQAMVRNLQGDSEAGVSLARRGYEVAERLGDVFSRSLALSNMAWAEMEAGDHESALASIEEADRLYMGAMGVGGEMEGWRGSMRAEALRGVGRLEEALEAAERASEVCRERGIDWGGVLALQSTGRTRAELGDLEGANEALEGASEIAAKIGATVTLDRLENDRRALAAGSR